MSARDTASARIAVGATIDRFARVSPAARAVHRHVLTIFAATGAPPTRDTLAQAASAADLDTLLRELHDRDVIRLDTHGAITAAYPFSAHPTAHTVAIADGPRVYAMCAIDALGMAAMLGRDTTIDSADPHHGQPITVTVHNGRARSRRWSSRALSPVRRATAANPAPQPMRSNPRRSAAAAC